MQKGLKIFKSSSNQSLLRVGFRAKNNNFQGLTYNTMKGKNVGKRLKQ